MFQMKNVKFLCTKCIKHHLTVVRATFPLLQPLRTVSNEFKQLSPPVVSIPKYLETKFARVKERRANETAERRRREETFGHRGPVVVSKFRGERNGGLSTVGWSRNRWTGDTLRIHGWRPPLANMEHIFMRTSKRERDAELLKLLLKHQPRVTRGSKHANSNTVCRTVIFANSHKTIHWLDHFLDEHGFTNRAKFHAGMFHDLKRDVDRRFAADDGDFADVNNYRIDSDESDDDDDDEDDEESSEKETDDALDRITVYSNSNSSINDTGEDEYDEAYSSHGTQSSAERARQRQKILICTDWGRVSLAFTDRIINYDTPHSVRDYFARAVAAQRSCRRVISFVSFRPEVKTVNIVEQLARTGDPNAMQALHNYLDRQRDDMHSTASATDVHSVSSNVLRSARTKKKSGDDDS